MFHSHKEVHTIVGRRLQSTQMLSANMGGDLLGAWLVSACGPRLHRVRQWHAVPRGGIDCMWCWWWWLVGSPVGAPLCWTRRVWWCCGMLHALVLVCSPCWVVRFALAHGSMRRLARQVTSATLASQPTTTPARSRCARARVCVAVGALCCVVVASR